MNNKTNETAQASCLETHEQHCSPASKWATLIDDTLIPAPQRFVTAKVLLAQAGAESKILVRDHGGTEDLSLEPDQLLDLAQGNVFYVVAPCDAPPKVDCTA